MKISVPETSRYEIKFVTTQSNLDAVLMWLKLSPAVFTEIYQPRWVRNIYFDTYNYDSFIDNFSGQSARVKVRYRSYGRDSILTKGAFEVKCRRNFYGWKKVYPVDSLSVVEDEMWSSIRSKLMSAIPLEAQFWLKSHPFAVLANSYRRTYFQSANSLVRVTVDEFPEVWDQRLKSFFNNRCKAMYPKKVIAEFKFARGDREFASKCLQGFPLRVSKHSKYITGVEAIAL